MEATKKFVNKNFLLIFLSVSIVALIGVAYEQYLVVNICIPILCGLWMSLLFIQNPADY